jgi:hypothetical protein
MRDFTIVKIARVVETIAAGKNLKERDRLVKDYGNGRWRKVKGIGLVRSVSGELYQAQLHWFEAHGLGRFEMKVKKVFRR